MKLQISFDLSDLDKALEIAQQVNPYADSLEIGSLLLYKYGARAIERFRETFPEATLFADSKLVDRGKEVVTILTQAGADWISVMAGTNKDIIHSVCTAAHDENKKVMIDLLDANSLGQSALEAKSLGGDALLFHKPYSEKDALLFLDKWDMVRGNTTLPVFVSNRISRETIDEIIAIKPNGIIIGKAIIEAKNPIEEAQFYREKCTSSSED